jgi:N-acetylneuraminic acid mutarotase
VFFASGYFYVLGGNLGSLQPTGVLGDIVRFDPAATTVELLGEQLPAKVASRIGAVYDGTSAYLIGGLGMGSKTDAIVRYAPGGSATTMGAALPEPYDGGAYVEHAGHVFIFGGAPISAEPGSDQVLEYVPATDTVTDTGMHLPSARKGLAGAAAGGAIYLFGGKGPSGPLDEIVKVSFE